MKRPAIFAAAGMSLILAAAACAAPKKEAKSEKPQAAMAMGAKGSAKMDCCATVAAGRFVSACEVGNAGFFTKTECQMGILALDMRALKASHLPLSATANMPVGNAAFFSQGCCGSGGACCSDGSCCAGVSSSKSAKAKDAGHSHEHGAKK